MKKYLVIIILFFVACKKEQQENILSGKLKSIEYRSEDSSGFKMYLEYDEISKNLIRVTDDSLRIALTIEPESNHQIVIRNYLSSEHLIVNVLPNKNIESVDVLDTLTSTLTRIYAAKYDSAKIDTITEAGSIFISDIQNYDFVTDGFNYLSHAVSWTQMDFFYGTRRLTDTVQYGYSPHVYNNYVPLQRPFQSSGFILSGNLYDNIFTFNLLEINGYNIFNKNKHLIQSVTSVNRGYQTNFSYRFNAKNQVTEMDVSNPDGTGNFMRYKFTYYE